MSYGTSSRTDESLFIGAYSSWDLVFLRAVTPLHVGVGRAGGVVDMPVQKDLYGYPVVYASSLKGALKSVCLRVYQNQKDRNKCIDLFGSLPSETPTKPGKVMVLDAQSFLIPVRLLRGVYGYITSPLLLKRFIDYLELMDPQSSQHLGKLLKETELKSNEVITTGHGIISIKSRIGDKEQEYIVINEEFWLTPKRDEKTITEINKLIPAPLQREIYLKNDRLLVVSDSDDISLQIVEKSLLRLQRIRLKQDVKMVETGALWSEEYVPRNTVLYTLLLYPNNDVKEEFRKYLNKTNNYLILGGNETIGKGLVKLYFFEKQS